MPRKVCVVVTARPSYSRVRSVLAAIQEHPDLELQLVVAASALLDRYGNAHKVIEAEGFPIDRRVYMILEGENLVTSAKSTGLGVAELATVFDNLGPTMVVTIADRFETMATAIAASYQHIPLVHIQGGEVTGSIDEKVRHAVTKLADIHFVATEKSAERVIRMGERSDRVFITGCPSLDVASSALERPPTDLANVIESVGGVGPDLDLDRGYMVVMQHPVTTEHTGSQRQIEETLVAVTESEIPTLWFWPNVDAGSDGTSRGIRAFRERHGPGNIHFVKNVPPDEFLRLVYDSRLIVGNSSVGVRECSFMGVPAVNIGTRQSGRERGQNVVDVDYERTAIAKAIDEQANKGRLESDLLYGDGNAGPRVAELLATAPLSVDKRLTY